MNKNKRFLLDILGEDFLKTIQQITSSYDVPMSFDGSISPEMIRHFLNYFGPMYIFDLDGAKYLYQDRGDYEWFIGEKRDVYLNNEIPEQLGIAKMGLKFSDIIDMFFIKE